MLAASLHAVAQISMERLLNGLAEGTAVAAFAWVLLRMVGRRNSGTRFVVWFCALVGMALTPFAGLGSSSGLSRGAGAAVTVPGAWSLYLFAAWAVVAALGLARVAWGLWHLRCVRRECTPVDPAALDPRVAKTVAEFRLPRCVELLASGDVRVPTAIGFFHPAVIVPSWALRELNAAQLNSVILHELAHLRRWDDWTNLAQKTLRALFFFHPAVWWVESRLSLEREMACDDLVLAHTANPRAYAECLVSLAEKNLLQRGAELAQAAVGRMRQTSLRVLQILDVRRPGGVRVWQPAPWVVAGFSVVCLVSAAHAPKLIAFRDAATMRPPQMQSSSFAGVVPTYVAPVLPAKYVTPAAEHFVPVRARASMLKNDRRTVLGAAPARRISRVMKSANVTAPVLPAPPHESPSAARVVRTSFAEFHPVIVVQQTVYLFVQNPSLGGVPVIWKVSVWQLGLSPQPPASLAPDSPSKSI
jgi:Zn-dependent protease with chaperone function